MNLQRYRTHCLSKQGVSESFPFDEFVLVHKVGNKIFALADIRTFTRINVKCDPSKALELRDRYAGVVPAWHMNKKHWNSLLLHEDLTDDLIFEWIDHSYALVVASLTRCAGQLIR